MCWPDAQLRAYCDDSPGQPHPVLLWRFAEPMRTVSSGVLGGGLGLRDWVLNAQVSLNYDRPDPDQHLHEIAAGLGLDPTSGIGLMTAARVRQLTSATDGGVRCDATVGLSYPTWAAAPADTPTPAQRWRPGTINLVCLVPIALADAALVNAVATATEAKSQALMEAGIPATGTASDAIVIACPASGPAEPYAGPRSTWGARLARAVHAAVADGTSHWISTHANAGHYRGRQISRL